VASSADPARLSAYSKLW